MWVWGGGPGSAHVCRLSPRELSEHTQYFSVLGSARSFSLSLFNEVRVPGAHPLGPGDAGDAGAHPALSSFHSHLSTVEYVFSRTRITHCAGKQPRRGAVALTCDIRE